MGIRSRTTLVAPYGGSCKPSGLLTVTALTALGLLSTSVAYAQTPTVKAQGAFVDWNQQKPAALHEVSVADLPEPNPAEAVENGPALVARPEGAMPIAPPGFKFELYAGGDYKPAPRDPNTGKPAPVPEADTPFREPRLLRTAPMVTSSSRIHMGIRSTSCAASVQMVRRSRSLLSRRV